MRRLALLALVLLVLPLPLLSEEALTNDGVLKMVSLGLGDEVVIAKIREAHRVDFRLEVGDLEDLRKGGATDRVIAAMLERSRPASRQPTEREIAAVIGIDFVEASLETREGTLALVMVRGDMSSSGFLHYRNEFIDYPGLRARLRTPDRRPSLLVKCSTTPAAGHFFLAKLDSDQDDRVRSLKISSFKGGFRAAFGSDRGVRAPDEDWVIPFDVREESPGLWRVTPKRDLPPGEYGWYVGFTIGPQSAGLFDFGVD